MVRFLRILSLLCLLSALIFWVSTGANRGWSKTSEAIPRLDPITEIEYVEYETRFIPGIDFLALGFISAGTLFLLSVLGQKITTKKKT